MVKMRDKWITIIFIVFIMLVPVVTVVTGLLPQSTEENGDSSAVFEGNGTIVEGQEGNAVVQVEEQKVEIKDFLSLQTALNQFTETLFLRKNLIEFNTDLTALLTGGTYIESTQVLLGKNNWIFYKTELDGFPIHDYMGINHYTEEQLAAMAANLVNMRDTFRDEYGIDFFIAGIPNKEIVYEEYMPDTISRVNKVSKAEQVAEYIWANTDLVYSYPLEALLAAKEQKQVYYSTDTHWNQLGAFVGFQDLYSKAYGQEPATLDSVTFIEGDELYAGDLANMAGIQADYKQDVIYTFDKESADPAQYHDEVVLLVGDSFGGFYSTVAKGYYKDVIWKHTTEFNMGMIEEYNPDVIIWESVERYLDTFLGVNLLYRY